MCRLSILRRHNKFPKDSNYYCDDCISTYYNKINTPGIKAKQSTRRLTNMGFENT